jgi:hypothetical protein
MGTGGGAHKSGGIKTFVSGIYGIIPPEVGVLLGDIEALTNH